MKWHRGLSLLLITLSMASGCGRGGDDPSRSAQSPPAVVEVPESRVGRFKGVWGVAWPSGSELVVARSERRRGDAVSRMRVGLLDTATQSLRPVDLVPTSECGGGHIAEYSSPAVLADGRVSLVQSCVGFLPGDAVIAFDPADSGSTPIRPDVLVPDANYAGLGKTRWNLRRDLGVTTNYSQICGSIAMLDEHGLTPFDVEMPSPTGTWSLADHFSPRDPCTDIGLAIEATWQGSSSDVLFFASGEAMGVEGLARNSQPWTLYRMNVDEPDPKRVVGTFGNPIGLDTSANGSWAVLGVTSEIGTVSTGTWLLGLDTARLVQVHRDGMACTWHADGTRLACLDIHPGLKRSWTDVLLLDVAEVVDQRQ